MKDIDYTSVACEYCGALNGEGCKTSGGHACRPHYDRIRPLREAWWFGYHVGQEDFLRSPEWYERERRRWLEREANRE